MKNFKKVLKNLVDVPMSGHTRDCSVMTYHNRIEIKIPLYFEKVTNAPTISYNKDSIKVVWIIPNLQRQD